MNVHDSSGRALQRRVKSSPDQQAGKQTEFFFLSILFFYLVTLFHTLAQPGQAYINIYNGSIVFDKTTVIYTSHVREVP